MKKLNSLYKTVALGAIALVSTSCTDDANSIEENDSQSKFVSIIAGIGTNQAKDTRTTYEANIQQDGSASMIIRWEEEEEIAIFHKGLYHIEGESNNSRRWVEDFDILRSDKNGLSDEGKYTTFRGKVTVTDMGGYEQEYCAMYPIPDEISVIDEGRWSSPTLHYSFKMENTQDCLEPTAHLKKNDIMSCSSLHYPFESGIDFEHRLAILRIAVTIPESKSIKSLTLSTPSSKIFYNKINVRLYGNDSGATMYGEENSNSFTLNLLNDVADKQVTAYMMMCPNSTVNTLTVTAVAEDGTSYSKTFNSGNTRIQQGYCYTIKQALQ